MFHPLQQPSRERIAMDAHPSMLLATLLFIACTFADAQGGDEVAQARVQVEPAVTVQDGATVEQRRQFAEAVRLYRAGRWSAAYGRFMALADRGDARAARIALSMQRQGPQRYGAQWDATPEQLATWQHNAQPAGSLPLASLAD